MELQITFWTICTLVFQNVNAKPIFCSPQIWSLHWITRITAYIESILRESIRGRVILYEHQSRSSWGPWPTRNKGAELITEIGHDKAKKLISSAVYYMSLSLKCVRTYVARRTLFTNICQGTGTRRRLYSFHFRSIDLYFHFLDVCLLHWWAVVSMDTRWSVEFPRKQQFS